MSASIDGDSIAWTLLASLRGACGSSDIASTAFVSGTAPAPRHRGVVAPVSAGTRPAPRGTESAHLIEHPEATLALAYEG